MTPRPTLNRSAGLTPCVTRRVNKDSPRFSVSATSDSTSIGQTWKPHPLVYFWGGNCKSYSCFSQPRAFKKLYIISNKFISITSSNLLYWNWECPQKWNTMCIEYGSEAGCNGPKLSAQCPWVATDIGHQWGSPVDIPVQLGPAGCLQRILFKSNCRGYKIYSMILTWHLWEYTVWNWVHFAKDFNATHAHHCC